MLPSRVVAKSRAMFKRSEDLTLIEVLVSISITCMVGLFTVPSFRDTFEKRLSTVSNHSIAAMINVLAESIREFQPISFLISSSETNDRSDGNCFYGSRMAMEFAKTGVE